MYMFVVAFNCDRGVPRVLKDLRTRRKYFVRAWPKDQIFWFFKKSIENYFLKFHLIFGLRHRHSLQRCSVKVFLANS